MLKFNAVHTGFRELLDFGDISRRNRFLAMELENLRNMERSFVKKGLREEAIKDAKLQGGVKGQTNYDNLVKTVVRPPPQEAVVNITWWVRTNVSTTCQREPETLV